MQIGITPQNIWYDTLLRKLGSYIISGIGKIRHFSREPPTSVSPSLAHVPPGSSPELGGITSLLLHYKPLCSKETRPITELHRSLPGPFETSCIAQKRQPFMLQFMPVIYGCDIPVQIGDLREH